MNTLRPHGDALPARAVPGLVRRVLATGRPAVSGLLMGAVPARPVTAVAIPLPEGVHGARALIYGQPVSRLQGFLRRQELPAGWRAELLDQEGGVIAASGAVPAAISQPAGPPLLAALAPGGQGRLGRRDAAGASEFLAYSRSDWSGWTVVLRMQRGVLLTSLYREVSWAATGILAALAAGAAMAWYFNRATLGSLAALGEAARRAADGDRNVRVPLAGPLEIVRLARRFNEMQAAHEAADARLELAASVFSATAEGIVLADAQMHIVEANRAFQALSGYSREELIGKSTRILQSGKQDRAYYERMWQAITERGHWQGQIWDRRRDGSLFAAYMTISRVVDGDGAVSHYIALFSDITTQRLEQDEIERVAYTDPLTQLPNRRLLADRLRQALARAQRNGALLAVCAIDLDGFKAVNDACGHEAGDQVLVAVAERLQRLLRANDTVARLGGDEFMLLLADLDQAAHAEEIVARAVLAVREPIVLPGGGRAEVSASIGIALYPADAGSGEELMRLSDGAMYQAKRRGRDQFCRAGAEQDR